MRADRYKLSLQRICLSIQEAFHLKDRHYYVRAKRKREAITRDIAVMKTNGGEAHYLDRNANMPSIS